MQRDEENTEYMDLRKVECKNILRVLGTAELLNRKGR